MNQSRFIFSSFITAFQKMEDEENLFSLRENGIYYWDTIRIDVFVYLYNSLQEDGEGFVWQKHKKFYNIFDYLKNLIKKVQNLLITRYILKRRPKYFFFTARRFKNNFDPVCDYPLNLLEEEAIDISILDVAKTSYFNLLINKKTLVPLPAQFVVKKISDISTIEKNVSSIVFKHFQIEENFESLITHSLQSFNNVYYFYKTLFLKHKPEAIFLGDNGGFKGMYAAASEIDIPVFELQHGHVSKDNIRYSYPKSIGKDDLRVSLPYGLLTFSEYWNQRMNFPVKMITSIGNNYFNLNIPEGSESGVLVISSFTFQKLLIDLTKQIANLIKDKTFFFKLHPQEFSEKEKIAKIFEKNLNVSVLSEEKSIIELFESCNNVIGIDSTMVIVALSLKRKVYLYKKNRYEAHKDTFDYLEIFENADELKTIISKSHESYFKNLSSTPTFFEPFNKTKFLEIVNKE